MKAFLVELHRRNALLSIFGWLCLVSGIICAIMTQLSNTNVLGINAYIKPMKFFFSITIFSWTMAWYMFYLQKPRNVRAYSIAVIVALVYEMVAIVWQAAHGRLSHFNNDTPIDRLLFALMGLAILTFWVWTLIITIMFFRKKDFNLPPAYLWSIRLGLVLFLIFSLEGGMMLRILAHTVGAPDGGPGLPVVNWSTKYGDLRVAHFFGMHALQIIPLFGYFITKKVSAVVLFSTFYFIFVSALLAQAMSRIPLFF
jgi:hypothetical protein